MKKNYYWQGLWHCLQELSWQQERKNHRDIEIGGEENHETS